MAPKTTQLQIRITPEQKRNLKQLARQASMDVSAWVLGRALPDEGERFQALVVQLTRRPMDRFALAEIADFLRDLPAGAFRRAVCDAPRARLDPATLNHLAGAIELAARRRNLTSPSWTAAVAIPEAPVFGSSLASVRLHLLRESPVALRRRNLFMDASLDDRV
jgi:predicted transcriptional regulator